jgi:hypothetical protein
LANLADKKGVLIDNRSNKSPLHLAPLKIKIRRKSHERQDVRARSSAAVGLDQNNIKTDHDQYLNYLKLKKRSRALCPLEHGKKAKRPRFKLLDKELPQTDEERAITAIV